MLAHPGEEAFFLTKNSTDSLDIDIPCEYDQHNRCNVGTDRLQVEVFADGTAVVYVYHYYVSNANVTIASQYQNGTWTNKCGYFDDRGKAICEGLQGYEAIENFDI